MKSHENLKFTKLMVGVSGHLMGVSVLAAVFMSFFLNETTLSLAWQVGADNQLRGDILGPIVVTIGLAALVWFLIMLIWRRVDSYRQVRVVARPTGTIMTETLIVMPVFLLMTMGLAQMGQRSMAGLLTTLGTYQAARTLAVWGPEVSHTRLGPAVTSQEALDRARIAAAMVITPVGSLLLSQQACASSTEFNNVIAGMQAALVMPMLGVPKASSWNFVEAFGEMSFAQRAPVKMRAAYCNVTVSHTAINDGDETEGNDFDTTVTYFHKGAFPLVRNIFANGNIQRRYRMRSFIPPNDELPLSVAF